MSDSKTTRRAPRASGRHALSHQLREIIDSRGITAHALGRLAGVDAGVVNRFLRGERDIRLETADRLAAALRLRLVEVGKAGGRGRPARQAVEGPGPGPDPEGTGAGPADASSPDIRAQAPECAIAWG